MKLYKAFIISVIIIITGIMLLGISILSAIISSHSHVIFGLSFGLLTGSTILTAAGGLIEALLWGTRP